MFQDSGSEVELCSEEDQLEFFSSSPQHDNDDLPAAASHWINIAESNLMRLYGFFLFMFQSLFQLSDTAVNVLLSFLALFFQMVAWKMDHIGNFQGSLPRNLRAAHQLIRVPQDPFRKYYVLQLTIVCMTGRSSL